MNDHDMLLAALKIEAERILLTAEILWELTRQKTDAVEWSQATETEQKQFVEIVFIIQDMIHGPRG